LSEGITGEADIGDTERKATEQANGADHDRQDRRHSSTVSARSPDVVLPFQNGEIQ